jgi:RimJ/RimL family protein N-acetyltransferase
MIHDDSGMDHVGFVPADFVVHASLNTPQFWLEPLGPEHNEADYEAWTSSIDHIRETPGFPDGNWPDGRSLSDNLRDLRRHAADFEQRRGFTYTVRASDTGEIVGCVYIYPDPVAPRRASVQSWVRASRAELDVPLWTAVSAWLAGVWPFESVGYATRAAREDSA